jgi:dolichol-phosphate mannosyltransferase
VAASVARLSVVLPTFREGATIGPMLRELQQHLAGVDVEYIVVDDASDDGTAEQARAACPAARVIVRRLATAVVRGIKEATGTFVLVMDADGQHPPEVARRLLEKAEATGADLVAGSRYIEGGSGSGLGPVRKLVSAGASTLARVALPPVRRQGLTDPMTGLFLVRRDRVQPDALRPTGYKILLEIVGRCPIRSVAEVGYRFRDRRGGQSKLGGAVIFQYLAHLVALGWSHPENQRLLRFALVGASGVVVNLGILAVLHGLIGIRDLLAVPIAIEASILSNWLLNDRFTFRDRRHDHIVQRLLKFNLVSLLSLGVQFSTYYVLTRGFGLFYLLAAFIAIVVAFGANYLGNLHWAYGGEGRFRVRKNLKRLLLRSPVILFVAARGALIRAPKNLKRLLPWAPFILIVGASGVLYFGDLDHIRDIYFDEHYYVSVARQIDNGIWEDPCWANDQHLPRRPVNFEHPPLAKLIIAWSVDRFDTEHGVFSGCRDPNGAGKDEYDAFTAQAREKGNPWAWRGPSAVMGVLTVLFTGLAAARLFGGPGAAALAGGFVALDTLVYTSSRLAILDIFATGFLMGAVYYATHPTRGGVLLTGIFLGLGFASKFTVAFAGPAVLLLALWVHHRAGLLKAGRVVLMLVVLPLTPILVLLASYAPWLRIWIRDEGVGWSARHLEAVLHEGLTWGTSGEKTHSFHSGPIEWFPMMRPFWYYHRGPIDGNLNEYVYAVGNPVIWWGGAVAVMAVLAPYLYRTAVGLVRGDGGAIRALRDMHAWQAVIMASLVPMTVYLVFFIPQRAMYLFYMTLLVPLLALPLAGALMVLWRRGGAASRLVVVLVVLFALAAFSHYYPVVHPVPITEEHYGLIMQDTLPWMDPCPANPGNGFSEVC